MLSIFAAICINTPKSVLKLPALPHWLRMNLAVQAIPFRMSSEDFGWYLLKAPGMLLRFGTRNESKGCTFLAHCNDFCRDESGMPSAILVFTAYVTKGEPLFVSSWICCLLLKRLIRRRDPGPFYQRFSCYQQTRYPLYTLFSVDKANMLRKTVSNRHASMCTIFLCRLFSLKNPHRRNNLPCGFSYFSVQLRSSGYSGCHAGSG